MRTGSGVGGGRGGGGQGAGPLTETKLTDDRYPKFVQGYHVIASCAISPQQGGVALLCRDSEELGFLVEVVNIVSPNVLTFQSVTGGVHFFVMGAYIPPADMTGVDDLRSAWELGWKCWCRVVFF